MCIFGIGEYGAQERRDNVSVEEGAGICRIDVDEVASGGEGDGV